ncbi:MAG: DUF2135 domain-containing protein [Candidatus Riflebacteria bacterium]
MEGADSAAFSRGSAGWFSEYQAQGRELKSEVTVAIPQSSSDQVMVEQAQDGDFYFCIQGSRQREKSEKSIAAKKVAIYFDVSNSAVKRDIALEKQFLQKLAASGKFNDETEFVLIPFRHRASDPEIIKAGADSINRLLESIDRQVFDGASSMASMNGGNSSGIDFALLFSDGINTYGKSMVPEIGVPVITLSSSDGADYDFLKALARRTGGKFINLKENSAAEAVKLAGDPFWGIISKSADRGAEELVPGGAQVINGRFFVAGKLTVEQSKVYLVFGGESEKGVAASFDINRNKVVKGEFLRRLWAGAKIAELMAAKDENRREIVKLSSRHGMVNEFTSLIVLERVDQYVEHRIIPPATKPQWREQYFSAVESEDAREKNERSNNIENVLAMWEARLNWWKTDFSKVDLNQLRDSKKRMRGGDGVIERNGVDSLGGAPGGAMRELSAPVRTAPQSAPMMETAGDAFDSDQSMQISNKAVDEESIELKKDQAEDKPRSVNPGVAIKPWKPDAEYTKSISKAKDKFAEYLNQKKEFGDAPSFYLDCSDLFNDAGQSDLAVQVLSNLAELELENPALLRILAHRLAQLEELEASSLIFAEVLEMKREEPQSYRDLALVLGRAGRFEEAITLLADVVAKTWDGRFPEIEVIALEELNNLIVKAKKAGITSFKVDERLIKPIDVDLRIVMTWDADMTDMDLWVIEPSGEKAFYSNPRSAIGGLVSRDFTRGYGPEEYMIRKAKTGTYEIQTNFFGSTSQKIAGAVTLQVDIFTNYGRDDEKRRSVTLRLKENRETFTVAEVEF